jgi:F-type H+-transporting ATPase subunit epsilon
MDEAAAEQARNEALVSIENQASEFDYGRASARLAEAAAQLRTLQKIRQKAGR